MKEIDTYGIHWIEPLEGSGQWFWGTDYSSGDLYEAENLFKKGYSVEPNRLVFVHYPEGEVIEPVLAEPGQYFEKPIYDNGRFIMLLVDFPLAKINIIAYKPETKKISSLVTLPLAVAENCRNLALRLSPLMLVRQSDDKFQILWPENKSFPIGSTECFYFRKEEKLYFSAWYEDPDYRVEIIIRDFDTGKVIKKMPGSIRLMPDGQQWLLL